MKLTADDARKLSKLFRDVSVALGDYRFGQWKNLSEAERKDIEAFEYQLLNYSSDFITLAVGLTLDDARCSLAKLEVAMNSAREGVANIEFAKKIITVAGAVVKLAAAIAAKDTDAMGGALRDITGALKADEGE